MKRKTIITLLLIFSVVFTFCVPEASAVGSMDGFKPVKTYNGNFKDVSTSAWYYKYVKVCYEYNLVVGTSDTTYTPSSTLTVAELITAAARLHCIYVDGAYTLDAVSVPKSQAWYTKYVNYAIDNSIIQRGDFTDAEMKLPATRDIMVHVFSNIFPKSEYIAYNNVNSIPDMKSGDKYYDEILTLYRAGIVVGVDAAGTFAPKNTCTRAEAAGIFAMLAIPSMRHGYTAQPLVSFKNYSRKFTNTTIAFEAPSDYAESVQYGKTVVESKSTGVITAIDALRDSELTDVSILTLFDEAGITEFYETDFAQSDEPITVSYCKAQPMSYGTVGAYRIKISYSFDSANYDCIAIIFITDSTLFEVMFDAPAGSAVLSQMADSFAVNGHNMYAK